MSTPHLKLARILRTEPSVILTLEQKLNNITGKSGIMEKIVMENEMLVGRTLEELGLERGKCNAKSVYEVLVRRLTHMDRHLYNFLGKPDLAKMSLVCGKLCDVAVALNKPESGFFIKKEKAVEMLEKFPPDNLLEHFGYKTAGELVAKQGFSSVFSSLRFAQDQRWMHKFFDEGYNDLTVDDFEERDVELKILEPQWLDVAEKFLEKKYHNVSHLKEFGIIFITPIKIDAPGETMRMFTLLLHYLNEVPFYSKLFKKFTREANFVPKLQSLLRGDVSDEKLPDSNLAYSAEATASAAKAGQIPNSKIRIVQRYLAKDDPNDFRLIEPHINPEAEHWYKAEGDLAKLSGMVGAEGHSYGYWPRSENSDGSFAAKSRKDSEFLLRGWQGLDFVGDFFPDGLSGQTDEELIAFDLIDLVMSLAKKGEIKYLYHQQEALWNKIFIEYLGRDKVNELVEENIINGFIKL